MVENHIKIIRILNVGKEKIFLSEIIWKEIKPSLSSSVGLLLRYFNPATDHQL